MTRRAMGSHQSSRPGTEIWLTPPEIIEALGGPDSFDLDPCSPFRSPIRTARRAYSFVFQDGLAAPWNGRVFLNPPYTNAVIGKWLAKLARHARGTTLIFARTETDNFFNHVWARASAVLFLRGRLNFHHLDGRRADNNAGAPSVLCAYGEEDADILAHCGLPGQFNLLNLPRFVVLGSIADASWREVVAGVVSAKDGPVALADLYRALSRHPKARRNPHFREKIRQTLQKGPFERVGPGLWKASQPDLFGEAA